MRDPKRIQRILDGIEELWKLHPDQRLGQLLENYVWPEAGPHPSETGDGLRFVPGRDIFHFEDDDTEAKILVALAIAEASEK